MSSAHIPSAPRGAPATSGSDQETLAVPDRAAVPRFATELVAWVATPWALAGHSTVLAGAAVLLLIALPAVFVTPGEGVKVVVPVAGRVTIGLVVAQMLAAVVSAWVAWPAAVAVIVSILVAVTIRAEVPRWRRLAGGAIDVPDPAHVLNEGLGIVLELLGLAALAWWGATTGGPAVRLLLGIGMPLAGAAAWGLFVAPGARMKPSLPGVVAVQALGYGAGAASLDAVGHPALALVYGVLAATGTVVATLDRNAYVHRTREIPWWYRAVDQKAGRGSAP